MRFLAVIPLTLALVIAGCGGNSSQVSFTPSPSNPNPGGGGNPDNPGGNPGGGNGGTNPGGGNGGDNGGGGDDDNNPDPILPCDLPNPLPDYEDFGSVGLGANYLLNDYTEYLSSTDLAGTWVMVMNDELVTPSKSNYFQHKAFFIIKKLGANYEVANCSGFTTRTPIFSNEDINPDNPTPIGYTVDPWSGFISVVPTSDSIKMPFFVRLGQEDGLIDFTLTPNNFSSLASVNNKYQMRKISDQTNFLGTASSVIGNKTFNELNVTCVVQMREIQRSCADGSISITSSISAMTTEHRHQVGVLNSNPLLFIQNTEYVASGSANNSGRKGTPIASIETPSPIISLSSDTNSVKANLKFLNAIDLFGTDNPDAGNPDTDDPDTDDPDADIPVSYISAEVDIDVSFNH